MECIDAKTRLGKILTWCAQKKATDLHAQSDLDLLWAVPDRPTAAALLPVLRYLEETAPMRLDGEVLLADGAGVNWRELLDAIERHGGDVLVKTMQGVETRRTSSLFDGNLL